MWRRQYCQHTACAHDTYIGVFVAHQPLSSSKTLTRFYFPTKGMLSLAIKFLFSCDNSITYLFCLSLRKRATVTRAITSTAWRLLQIHALHLHNLKLPAYQFSGEEDDLVLWPIFLRIVPLFYSVERIDSFLCGLWARPSPRYPPTKYGH